MDKEREADDGETQHYWVWRKSGKKYKRTLCIDDVEYVPENVLEAQRLFDDLTKRLLELKVSVAIDDIWLKRNSDMAFFDRSEAGYE